MDPRPLLPLLALFFACKGGDKADPDLEPIDRDGDGYPKGEDCDDWDGGVHPDATEICNQVDDDCDAQVDEGLTSQWWADADGDGYGAGAASESCEPKVGQVDNGEDCDDADSAVRPGATETCDGRDEDCDGTVDEGAGLTWYEDLDGDGYGDQLSAVESCEGATGLVAAGGDCDESDPAVNPGAEEICEDGLDQDCDGDDRSCSFYGTYDLAEATTKLSAPGASYDVGRQLDAGDVTGDGKADIVIATLYANSYNGGAFVVPSPVSGRWSLSDVGYYLKGTKPTYGGGRSVGIGDLSGDGVGDVLVGGPWADPPSAWITFGPISANGVLADADVQLIGRSGTYTSHGCDLGDVNGDGVADAIIGAYYDSGTASNSGKAFGVYGPLSAGTTLTLTTDSDFEILATHKNAYFGRWVQAGADMDGDGIGDMLIAAPYDHTSKGAAYIFHGPPPSSQTTDEADGAWAGTHSNGIAGEDIGLGDINGDGLTDALVGSAYDDAAANDAGALYVIFGPGTGSDSLENADIVVLGSDKAQLMGAGAKGGDLDGDGLDELVVGATSDRSGGQVSGSAFLFFGLEAGSYSASDADAVFTGERKLDYLGEGVTVGDLDGDGDEELILGAPGQDEGGSEGGAVYILGMK